MGEQRDEVSSSSGSEVTDDRSNQSTHNELVLSGGGEDEQSTAGQPDESNIMMTPAFYVGDRPLGSSAAEVLGMRVDAEPIEGEVVLAVSFSSLWRDRKTHVVCALLILLLGLWKFTENTKRERIPQGLVSEVTPHKQQRPLYEAGVKREQVTSDQRSTSTVSPRSTSGSRRARPPLASYLGGEVRGYTEPQWVKISAGVATIGSLDEEGSPAERPIHKANVASFEISKTEVTVLQYAQCVTAGVCSTQGLNSTNWGESKICNWARIERSNHPLNCVSWYQAKQYAEWVGGRLPSEVEWSYVAQGASSKRRIYPWGNEPASCERAVITDFVRGHGCGSGHTAAVCSRPLGRSKQGLCDLVGNVWEWVMDEWHPNYLGAPDHSEPWVNHVLSEWNEVERVYRGGGAFDERDFPRIARRGGRPPDMRLFNLGFRVARDSRERPQFNVPSTSELSSDSVEAKDTPGRLDQSGTQALTD